MNNQQFLFLVVMFNVIATIATVFLVSYFERSGEFLLILVPLFIVTVFISNVGTQKAE